MKDADEEYLVFLMTSENDLRVALKSLNLVDEQEFGYCQIVFLRDSVVSYGRPFSPNMGIHKNSHKLSVELVPDQYLELHNEIIRLRNTLFAHSDIRERNPKLTKLGSDDDVFVIESTPIYLTDIKERLKDMELLINSIKQKLGIMRKEFSKKL